jgi:hypothetical protein
MFPAPYKRSWSRPAGPPEPLFGTPLIGRYTTALRAMPARRPAATGESGLLRSRLGAGQDGTFNLFAAAAALAVAFLITRSPLLAAALVAVVALIAGMARFGRLLPVQLTLVTLPWLVVFDELCPPLLRTMMTAAAAIALLAYVAPLSQDSWMTWIGAALFVTIVLAHVVFAVNGEQLIQAAKFLIFPATAVAVVSPRGRQLLPEVRDVVFGSALAAMAAHLVVALLGLGSTGTYYGVGEKLGFASRSPAEISLLAVVVAGAGLAASRRSDLRMALFALGALPAILTGVRAALVSVVLIFALYAVRSRLSIRTVAAVGVVVVVFFVSGAADTVTARFTKEADSFSSFSSVGSGRGAIWEAALTNWADAGPQGWLFGTGLRSIAEAQLEELGAVFVGHSDIVEVGVQLGLVGLLGWLLIWLGLLRARLSAFVLLPMGIYAVITGLIEFVAPVVVGLVLAAAYREEGTARDGVLGAPSALAPSVKRSPGPKHGFVDSHPQ